MHWYNEPPRWEQAGDTLTVTAGPQTDFWRKTHHGYIRDDGHFFFQELQGDFSAQVCVRGAYAALYDQAGLMLRLNHETWVKCGIEYLDEVQQASVVVTRDFSDWSVLPLPDSPAEVIFRMTRQGDAVEVYFSRDGAQFTLLRQAYFPTDAAVQVGLMCCAPTGEGFEVAFRDYELKNAG
jgi:uncharacterized protein